MSQKQQQKIHFVTGKGGVGKSFFAAALAQYFSLAYKTTNFAETAPILLAELSDMSFYKDYLKDYISEFEIGFKPVKTPHYDIAQWTAQDCLKEYALHLLKIESLFKLFFENPISKALIEVSPGLNELAILGKATSHPRKHGPPLNYDQIVFDSPSTGHFLTMLRSPKALVETIQFGPMGEQSRSIDQWIRRSDFCEVHIVCLPEELPTTETIDLYRSIESEFGLKPNVYVNKFVDITKQQISSEKKEIQDYFLNIIQQQKNSLDQLDQSGISYKTIPFIYETMTLKLLGQASHYLQTLKLNHLEPSNV